MVLMLVLLVEQEVCWCGLKATMPRPCRTKLRFSLMLKAKTLIAKNG